MSWYSAAQNFVDIQLTQLSHLSGLRMHSNIYTIMKGRMNGEKLEETVEVYKSAHLISYYSYL